MMQAQESEDDILTDEEDLFDEYDQLSEAEGGAAAQARRLQALPAYARVPIAAFGVPLGFAGMTVLWRMACHADWFGAPCAISYGFWGVTICLLGVIALLYVMKLVKAFSLVKEEYNCPMRGNFFFAPGMVMMMLVIGPPEQTGMLHSPPP